MQIKSYFGIGAILVLIACNNAEKKEVVNKDSSVIKTEKGTLANINFKDVKVQGLYKSYIALKDALVATKIDEAKTVAKTLAGELTRYTGCENTAVIANSIENAKDIAEQRKQFTALSTDVIALFKHTELTAGTIYIQHCPMANKGDGGDWLSSEKKIQNPYYGNEMLECGAVVEEIKTK